MSCSAPPSIGHTGPGADRLHRRARKISIGLLASVSVLALDCSACTAAAARPQDEAVELAQTASPPAPQATCGEPDISVSPAAGGLTQVSVASSCRAGELVSVTYAEATLVERLDPEGRSKITLDCFAGDASSITIAFEDGTSITRQPATDDLAKYSKVAILWSSSVDLDLNAFEYAAAPGGAGHVWSGTPSSLAEAEARAKREKRGAGFLSTASAGRSIGMNVEVYTFVHVPGQAAAGVKMGVDFVSRGRHAAGEFCGVGRYAEVQFKAYTLEKGRVAKRLDLAFASLPCGTDISDAARINSRLIPELTIRE
ncbi:hypothetical protein [Hyphomicrobium sp.]|uniref:hypothetical protein n=1 Tax=Hyphomicrobium sp. TaxID=82 RepID=UPI003D0C786A